MKYIFLAVFLVLLVIIHHFYLSKVNEPLSMPDQKKYLKYQDKYWTKRKIQPILKNGVDDTKFVKLSSNKDKLVNVKYNAKVKDLDIKKKIEHCNILNKTKKCAYITADSGCGYCFETDTISYGDKNGPAENVCTKKGWAPPGPQAAFLCTKAKEQAICKDVKDCGDSVGEKAICGWCPLTGKGVVKKKEGNGWIPKYDDDGKCNWKKGMPLGSKNATSKFMGWYPNKLRQGVPLDAGEGDCDRDADCGKTPEGVQMKCGHDGRYMKNVVDSKGNPLKPNQGWKDYCYDPTKPKPGFDGLLIEPKDCKRFKQMFPCVGRDMFTGPHSTACLDSLWNKSGCSGQLQSRVTNQLDYNNWQKNSYIDVLNNMKGFKDDALYGKNYASSKSSHQKCFGKPVNPCLTRFRPRPMDCNRKLYDSIGCSRSGRLNPENANKWPNGYVGKWWKNMQLWYNNWYYKKNVNYYKSQADYYKRFPKKNFNQAIHTNMLCYGKAPSIPWTKPCWADFSMIMLATEYIKKLPDGSLDFKGNGGGGFKAILPIQNQSSGWTKEFGLSWKSTSSSQYVLTRIMYEKKYFPFWNFVKTNKSVWGNGRWSYFKRLMLSARGTKPGNKGKANAKWFGWGHESAMRRVGGGVAGEGDCDNDRDCKPGLKCGHDSTNLPGVRNTGQMGGGRDFCYDPNGGSIADSIMFVNGSEFDQIIPSTTTLDSARKQGFFFLTNGVRYVDKNIYLHENFPYWLFLRVASVN